MSQDPYDPYREPPREPDRGSMVGYAAIKYTAIVIIVLAILVFLYWVLTRFFG